MVEPSAKSIDVARRAQAIIVERQIGLSSIVANRVRDAEDLALVRASFPSYEIIAIPEDLTVTQSDREGRSPIDVDPRSWWRGCWRARRTPQPLEHPGQRGEVAPRGGLAPRALQRSRGQAPAPPSAHSLLRSQAHCALLSAHHRFNYVLFCRLTLKAPASPGR